MDMDIAILGIHHGTTLGVARITDIITTTTLVMVEATTHLTTPVAEQEELQLPENTNLAVGKLLRLDQVEAEPLAQGEPMVDEQAAAIVITLTPRIQENHTLLETLAYHTLTTLTKL